VKAELPQLASENAAGGVSNYGEQIPAASGPTAPSSLQAADRIPVRLPGGRRAFLEIPSPFFEADKERLKNQIDLLLTEDDEEP